MLTLGSPRLADVDVKLEQLAVNPRRAPQRIVAAHRTNQGSDVRRDCGSPRPPPPNLPRPKESEALTMPPDHRRRLHDGGTRLPILPDRRQPAPQKSISGGQLWAASPTIAEHRPDDEGPESQTEAPFAGARKPQKPPPAPPTEANKGIAGRKATTQAISNFEICENHRRASGARWAIDMRHSLSSPTQDYRRRKIITDARSSPTQDHR